MFMSNVFSLCLISVAIKHLMSTSLGLPWVTTDNVFETEILESDSLLEEESVLNTDGQIINLFDLSIYASTLQHEDRCSDELAAKSKLFIGVVLPELTSKYFTKTRYNVTTDENN
ncbi:uncharacterized protein LOC116930810 isoform X2 [Daphnia magna]|uniref:uncharacterized protein LOC116930810 isoform X2 n=1 Tax=Daphnia magna TaxID=35525 RepID=UPI001402492C|nr:uncharacterized protein LOC116930810 isoform X2 [Daphnia magna]